VTHLRQLMLDELQRRNYSPNTVRSYVHAVEDFARYFRRSPGQLGPDHVREYQVHLFRDRKLSPSTIEGQAAALRFLFVRHCVGLTCPMRSRLRSPKLPRPRASPSAFRHTRFGTASQRTCSRPAPISARSSCCSDMPSWPTRRSICICRAGICRLSPARWKLWRCRRQVR